MEELRKELEAASAVKFPYRPLVFGEGPENSPIVLAGEAPGGEEERQRRPFVGKAGKNLDGFLSALGLDRKNIYVTNLVKLRPFAVSAKTGQTVNRPPDKEEIAFFSPWLIKELAIIKPRIVVTLGNYPLKAVSGDKNATVGAYHGHVIVMPDYQIFSLYHPAAVLYNQSLKQVYQEDLHTLKSHIAQHIFS